MLFLLFSSAFQTTSDTFASQLLCLKRGPLVVDGGPRITAQFVHFWIRGKTDKAVGRPPSWRSCGRLEIKTLVHCSCGQWKPARVDRRRAPLINRNRPRPIWTILSNGVLFQREPELRLFGFGGILRPTYEHTGRIAPISKWQLHTS